MYFSVLSLAGQHTDTDIQAEMITQAVTVVEVNIIIIYGSYIFWNLLNQNYFKPPYALRHEISYQTTRNVIET